MKIACFDGEIFIFAFLALTRTFRGIQMRRRSQFEIMAEILSFCKKPQRKTRVMYHTNLSWKINEAHLTELELKGLLTVHHSELKYLTTQKGREFVEKLDELKQLF